ncbi:MAG: IS200/IS605 family transposase [Acidobacteria bacterium]|nr:IS200/IS605 family transposase [Acidobacteriota bacterium]
MSGKHISILIHFVWSTSGREPLIDIQWCDRLYAYLGGVFREKKAKLIIAGGIADHVHLYSSLPSTVTIAEMVNALKSNSSRWIHDTFPQQRAFAWQKGYGAFSVSKSAEARVIEYIRDQREHHRAKSFQEEFLDFLNKQGIEYDERYIWE